MKKLFLFIAFLFFGTLTIGCDDPSEPACGGACDSGFYCDKTLDYCVPYECSEQYPTGSCSSEEPAGGKKSLACEDGVCVQQPCSAKYKGGYCGEGEICNSLSGVCETPECSATYPNGSCPDGQMCNGGVCQNFSCSAQNPNGSCPTDQYCDAGVCKQYPCSSSHPTGLCPNGQTCVSGVCIDDTDRCSTSNPNGTCPSSYACIDGLCQLQPCSEDSPEGSCSDGEYCSREYTGGEYIVVCKPLDCSAENPTGACPSGQVCIDGTCAQDSCAGTCGPREVCEFGQCNPDPFYCSADSPRGWCPNGQSCIDGNCKTPEISPCDNIQCDTGKQCLVIDGAAVCTDDICSDSNQDGLCNDGDICVNGVCIEDISELCNGGCSEGKVCNTSTGLCVDDPCIGITCPDVNAMCTPKLTDTTTPYRCICKPGYALDFNQGICIFDGDDCTGVDCGEGVCLLSEYEPNGYWCQCNEGMEYLNPPYKNFCIDPTQYNYCDDSWSCEPHGECVVVERNGDRYAECQCDEGYLFNLETRSCEAGISCGYQICNPLGEICETVGNNSYCVSQACSAQYPEGDCGSNGICVDGTCITQECSSQYPSGYCIAGYQCHNGACEHPSTAGPKLIGESCDLEANNCEATALCFPTQTGEGKCIQMCDVSNPSCSDPFQVCISRGVFPGQDYDYIGVCVKDEGCNIATSDGCPYEEQVCLAFQNTSITQCLYTGPRPLGAACNTSQATQLCQEDFLCVEGRCVPNCSRYMYDSDFCYDYFNMKYEFKDLTLPYFGVATFRTNTEKDSVTLCNPELGNTCEGSQTCILVQQKDTTNTASAQIGVCTESCNPAGTPFRTQCSSEKICYNAYSGVGGVCLPENGCDPYLTTGHGCNGTEACYAITDNATACMKAGWAIPGDNCDFTTDLNICQMGQCIEGKCRTVCDLSDSSFECQFSGNSCESTTDSYYSSSSSFGTSLYGVCK
ncbi:hypothetical protein JXR93_13415 [bacterium]|nr:hypothetical protein [bacterium]